MYLKKKTVTTKIKTITTSVICQQTDKSTPKYLLWSPLGKTTILTTYTGLYLGQFLVLPPAAH